ncbi:hypothetical protein ABW20_dc0109987 [Dactylellina cionopaga]|nr:hypothetical protein ABW20_dc0109987 [Dactylellina cionopaga]
MSPRSRNLVTAAAMLLVTAASAQSVYTLPDVCTSIISNSQSCGASNLAGATQADYTRFYSCFCQNPTLPGAAQSCLASVDGSQVIGRSTIQTLETFDTLCKELAITNPIQTQGLAPTPTQGPVNPNSQLCLSLANSLTSCGAPSLPSVTSANVASCLCGQNVNLSNMVMGCLNYLHTANPTQSSEIAFFTSGYCAAYATPGGSFGFGTSGPNGFTSQVPPLFASPTPNFNPTGPFQGQTSVPRSAASSLRITLGLVSFGVFGVVAMIL